METSDGSLSGELSSVRGIGRALLVSDGTVTNLIEAFVSEPVTLVPLEQMLTSGQERFAFLDPAEHEAMAVRSILLRGGHSGQSYLYAESQIAIERLGCEFRRDLLEAKLPIGRIWSRRKLETYKEMLSMGRREAGNLDQYFRLGRSESMLFRTYRVFSGQRPIMVITETFPENWLHFPDSAWSRHNLELES
jgi:chorismate-pyruvate lyase